MSRDSDMFFITVEMPTKKEVSYDIIGFVDGITIWECQHGVNLLRISNHFLEQSLVR